MAALEFPPWQPRIEVWALIAGVAALGVYVARVLQPLMVARGAEPVTRRQRTWFFLALMLMWVASDWPLHDIGEARLYSAHMLQHMLLTVVVPPMFLLATPTWLAELVLGTGRVRRAVEQLTRPVVAGVLFNGLGLLSHWPVIVNLAVRNGPFHYLVHTGFFLTALLAWACVCGPLPKAQLSEPGKMVFVFVISLATSFPAAFLTAGDQVFYPSYASAPRLWIQNPLHDQQFAGAVMKVFEGTYLWAIIAVLFLRWMSTGSTKGQRFRGTLVDRSRLPAEPPGGEPGEDGGPHGEDRPGAAVHALRR